MNTLFSNDFEYIDFKSSVGNRHISINGNYCTLSRGALVRNSQKKSKQRFRCGFCKEVSAIINRKGLTHYRICKDRYTNQIAIVFFCDESDKAARIGAESTGQVRIQNAQFVNFLAVHAGFTDSRSELKSVAILLSEDKSSVDNAALFEVIGRYDD